MDVIVYDIDGNATVDYQYSKLEIVCWNLQIPYVLCQDPIFVITCLGFIYPIIAIFTTIANICSFIIFARFTYSATWMMLAGIALADMMTAISPTIHYVYLFTFENFRHFMPFAWCSTYFIAVEFFPLWFHSASVLLTVLICIQRYVCVCHPHSIKRYHSTKRNIVIIISAFLLAFLVHFHILFYLGNKTEEITIVDSADNNSTYKAISCSWNLETSAAHQTTHNAIYIILIEIIPCVLITILTIKIILKLQESRKFREQMTLNDVRCRTDTRNTTVMLVCLMIIFLLAEMPFVIFLLLITVKRYNNDFITNDKLYIMIVVQTLVVLLNCHLNFWIYCFMSKTMFRKSLKKLFLCQKEKEPEMHTSPPSDLRALSETTNLESQNDS